MLSFVDDAKNQVNLFGQQPQPTIPTLLSKMEEDAQLWHDLLWTSGGALELKTYSFHALSWFFHDGFPLLQGGIPKEKIILTTKENTQEIKALSNYESHKTLGHFQSPCRGQLDQFKMLLKKINDHAAFLQSNVSTKREVYVYYTGIYLPSISYLLANFSFLAWTYKK